MRCLNAQLAGAHCTSETFSGGSGESFADLVNTWYQDASWENGGKHLEAVGCFGPRSTGQTLG